MNKALYQKLGLERMHEQRRQKRKVRTDWRRQPRARTLPNVLRDWLEGDPRPMTKLEFAAAIGVTPSYVSMLLADGAPWPNRDLVRRIGEASRGAVTPNDLAGYSPGS